MSIWLKKKGRISLKLSVLTAIEKNIIPLTVPKKNIQKLVLVLVPSTPVITIREKAPKDTKTRETGENDKNDKNRDKDLGINLA